ncbi:hypothetical protein Hypma_014374 [Hypsizygus marmoreus]|uniref:F-box domain-containing protein n=1 Tax=Hypsizygus marmoreus TaxID=39966 RepID=A0A369JA09_HYPMA|nr:hypothetical protein Hypma_014374 [Hypsizygus marmoreus]
MSSSTSSSSPASMLTAGKIFALPSELLEQTLILTASSRFPSAIAALGRTCRYFHRLIYHSPDNHLWRQVFLAIFDDPRPLSRLLRCANAAGPMSDSGPSTDTPFDWAGEFMRRMDAARLIRKHTQLTPSVLDMLSDDQEIENIPFNLTGALETILSVLETALPFSPHKHDEFIPLAPVFPPIIILHASPIPFPDQFKSRNAAWVEEVLQNGYPPALVKRYLIAGHLQHLQSRSKPPEPDPLALWRTTDEAKLFHKLVFLKGFIPVPPESKPQQSTGTSDVIVRSSRQSSTEQIAAAREMARNRVYNMRYLMAERSWGPFLPGGTVKMRQPNSKATHATFPSFEQELSRYMLSVSSADDISDEEDPEWVPGDNDLDDDDDDVGEEVGFVFTRRRYMDPTFVRPLPHQVIPDYSFLSSARLLVETNLREALAVDTNDAAVNSESVGASVNRIVDAFGCLDLTRMGAAPAFWSDSWTMSGVGEDGGRKEQTCSASEGGNGKGKAKACDVVEGWDWAGVTGTWKRSVCWLDYRDLLLHNLNGHSGETPLEETMRIFPMTLRVSGYSKPPEPSPADLQHASSRELESLVWKFPVIHVDGESKGSDHDSNIIRKVTGTVRMIADGAVRWSLMSCYPGEDLPEWQTEGIQVGSIGSAVGIIGMWTGAEHASTDPLGPIWAWKVA